MFEATLLSLASAALHAGWNVLAKRSEDRFAALWGQFVVSATIGAVYLAVAHDLPAGAWGRAALTGLIHILYSEMLARAYTHGDFTVAYPIARGSGAVLAAAGGVALLDDDLGVMRFAAIGIVALGMWMLGAKSRPDQLTTALLVGLAIGVYTVNDSQAAREYGVSYAFAVFVTIGVTVTLYGVGVGRVAAMVTAWRNGWRQFAVAGSMVAAAYTLVLIAVRRAPVGYVASLRESSVLVAAFLGRRYLDERDTRRRTIAAGVILAGLVLLVGAR